MWKTFYLEIAKTGLWNDISFTKAMLKKILTNFKNEGVIPVTPNHIPDEWKMDTVDAKITNMQLSEDGKILQAEMQLKGWMLDKWEEGSFLKPSIELQNHPQIGWNIPTVVLLGEQAPGIKGLETEIAPFSEMAESYEKFVFCDKFSINPIKNKSNGNNNNNVGANMPTISVEEIKKEVKAELTLEFKDEIKNLKSDLDTAKAEKETAEKDLKTFKDDKATADQAKADEDLKKFNENVTEKATKMKEYGYKEDEITKFSEKYTDKVAFADVLEDIKLVDQRGNIDERYEFNENGERKTIKDEADSGSMSDTLK